MPFNSYSYEILYEQFHWIYLQGDEKLLLVTVNNRLKFEIEIVHDHDTNNAQGKLESWNYYNTKFIKYNRAINRTDAT